MDGKTWSEIAKSNGAGNRSSSRWIGWVLEPLTAHCSLHCDPPLVADVPWAAHHRWFMK